MAQRLAAPGRVDRSEPPRTLLEPSRLRSEDRNEPGEMQLVESPSIFRHGGKYILLYSVGDFALNNYKLGAAYSDRLIPPDGKRYEKVLRTDERKVWGEQPSPVEVVYVLQSQKRDWPNDCGGLVNGPGAGERDPPRWPALAAVPRLPPHGRTPQARQPVRLQATAPHRDPGADTVTRLADRRAPRRARSRSTTRSTLRQHP